MTSNPCLWRHGPPFSVDVSMCPIHQDNRSSSSQVGPVLREARFLCGAQHALLWQHDMLPWRHSRFDVSSAALPFRARFCQSSAVGTAIVDTVESEDKPLGRQVVKVQVHVVCCMFFFWRQCRFSPFYVVSWRPRRLCRVLAVPPLASCAGGNAAYIARSGGVATYRRVAALRRVLAAPPLASCVGGTAACVVCGR
jgi:hypothetical protein